MHAEASIMRYFSGLVFALSNSHTHFSRTEKIYPIYFGIQYNNSGPLALRIDDGPEFLADGPHVFITSPGHRFVRIFKNTAGLPPNRFLIRQRIGLGARLLVSSYDPIKSVAEKCGIGSPYYFSKLFKQVFMVSPSDYRREFAPANREPSDT